MRKRAAIFDILFFLSWVFIFIPLIRCSLRSRLAVVSPFRRFFDGQLKAKKMVSREPEARSDTNKEPSGNKSSVSPKVAATSSPTIYRSAVPSAMLSLSAALALSAPLLSALSPAPAPSPARRRRAHRRPPRASDAFFSTQRPPLTHDYIKSMVSLFNTVFVLLTSFLLVSL